MILLFRIIEQDHVEIAVAESKDTSEAFRVIGVCDFAKDASHLLLKNTEEALQHAGVTFTEFEGLAVQWSATARFTVSRLCGVTANTLAQSLHLPVIGFDVVVADQEIITALQGATLSSNPQIDIEYSGQPTITVKA